MNNRLLVAVSVAMGVFLVVLVALLAGRSAPSAELEQVITERQTSARDAFAEAGISASRACVFGP